ncbi:rhodanese-like domain-containing protein [bacterium]|nr:rhodanese-like domain-containing protein [bacterium]MBU1064528.1 rhodanese-like domain-containing protein [bacterium]MBU1633923.1 rhodanese-like domain-containing protein [bacterium]MBU1875061.1 rhodanese-like domain-containing protein [bacterium]
MDLSRRTISILKQSVPAVFVVSIFAVIFNGLSPNSVPLITPYRIVTIGDNLTKIPVFQTRDQMHTYELKNNLHPPEEIDLETAYKHFRNYTAIFIDTRSVEDYRSGHISRAVSIPLEALDFSREVLPELSRNERIIAYCDGEDCTQSIDLAVRLSEIGFNDVYFFFGGWTEWQNAGYPASIGDIP